MDSIDLTQAAFGNLSFAEVLVLLIMFLGSIIVVAASIYCCNKELKQFNARVRRMLARPPVRVRFPK